MVALPALLLCVSLAVLAAAAPTREDLFKANDRRRLNFKCRQPQLRSLLSTEVVRSVVRLGPSETVYPPYTVLHRCDGGSGCCDTATRRCTNSTATEVTLVFLITDAILKNSTYQEVKTSNHTMCHCQTIEEQPPR